MRGAVETIAITTDQVTGDSISNVIHKFRHNLRVLAAFRVTHDPDAAQYSLKPPPERIEGAKRRLVC